MARQVLATALLMLALPLPASTEQLPAKAYSTAEGLAHYTVNRIVRDSRGFIWFCTREGLSLFDGYGFTTFRTPDGLPSADVTDIVETPDGHYWIGTVEGLVRFDPRGRLRFERVPTPGDARSASISQVVRDPSGTLWVGTVAGLYQLDPSRTPLYMTRVGLGIRDELNTAAIQSIMLDRRGALWVAVGRGVVVRMPDGVLHFVTPQPQDPRGTVGQIYEDRAGRVWAATTSGLWRLAVDARGTPRFVARITVETGELWTTSFLETSDGALWVGTSRGVLRVQPQADAPRVRFVAVTTNRPQAFEVNALAEGEGGTIWVGTTRSGAVKLTQTGVRIIATPEEPIAATAIAESRAGEIVAVSETGTALSLLCVTGQGVRRVSPGREIGPRSWAWNQVLLQDSTGAWWIGTNRGVFRFARAASCADLDNAAPVAHFDSTNGLAADVAIRLFEDAGGDVWMATVGHGLRPDGLSRWDRRTGRVHGFSERDGTPDFQRHYVSAFASDRAGNVWVGFSGEGGLARFRDGRFTRFTASDGVPSGQVRNMVVDDDGRLWIASYRGGLCRVDVPTADRPTFRTYTTADGLSGNEIHTVVADALGRIYVGTAHGIDRLDPRTDLIRHYTQADGVPEGEMNAAFRDRRGVLWFTYIGAGVARFDPVPEAPLVPPRLFITRVSVNGAPSVVSIPGELQVSGLRLPAGRNLLEVNFVALGSRAAGDYLYRYRLRVDAPWSRFSKDRQLTLAGLGPGHYRLEIQARDSDGTMTAAPASVGFSIVPPLWRQRWFVGLLVLAGLGGTYGVHRYRMNRLLDVARVRDRIAADLHDHLGANLTKIAVLGEAARHQAARSEAALESIAGIARESVANMSDIVWAIDPGRDTLEDLVRKMRQHASETFAMGDVELSFVAPPQAEQRHLGVEFRHDLLLLFKETVNNAARHSHSSRVDVEVRVTRGRLLLRVTDDGVGFDPTMPSDGRGTASMRRRAERMGGLLEIQSRPGGGTTVSLALTLP